MTQQGKCWTGWLALMSATMLFGASGASAGQDLQSVTAKVLARSCVSKMRLDIFRPQDDRLYWRATMKFRNDESLSGYFRLEARPPEDTGHRVQKTYPEYDAVLTQVGRDRFILKKPGRPDCDIEITDYGVLLAPTVDANGYGGLIAPMLLVYDEQTNPEDEYTWGQESPEVTEENWVWQALMHPIESMTKIGETLAGGSNYWANPPDESTGKDTDFIDEDGDGYDDRDFNRNGEVSKTEKEYHYLAPIRRFFGME